MLRISARQIDIGLDILRRKQLVINNAFRKSGCKTIHGVANIGFRPTVGGEKLLLEVHLLDFEQDIYSERLLVEFRRRIRGEVRFDSFDALKAQIAEDVVDARRWLLEEHPL